MTAQAAQLGMGNPVPPFTPSPNLRTGLKGQEMTDISDEVFPTTRGVRAFISATGYLVILQEAEDHQETEQQILIPPNQIKTFIKAIQATSKAK